MLKYIAFLSFTFPLFAMDSLSKKSCLEEPVRRELQGGFRRLNNDVQRLIINRILSLPGLIPFLEARSEVVSNVAIEQGCAEGDYEYTKALFMGDSVIALCKNSKADKGLLRVLAARSRDLLASLPTDGYAESISECPFRRLVATGGTSVQIWSLDEGTCIKKFETNPGYLIGTVCFDKAGTRVAAGSDRVQVWDLETGKSLLETSSSCSGEDHPKNVCFDESGSLLLVGYFSGEVAVWKGRERIAQWKAHDGEIDLIDITKTGDTIITSSWQNGATVGLWDRQNFSLLGTRTYHGGREFPEFHRGSGLCVGLLDAHTVQIYSVESGAVLKSLRDANYIEGFHLGESGKILITWGSYTFIVWSVDTGEVLHILRHPGAWDSRLVRLNSAGNSMVILNDNFGGIELWDCGMPEYLKKVTFDQACLLRAVYEVIILRRLIKRRAESGKAVERLNGTPVSVNDIPQLLLDLDVRYADLKEAYDGLADSLKKIVHPYISLAARSLAKC